MDTERTGRFVPSLNYQPTFINPEQFYIFLRIAKAGARLAYAVACNLERDNRDSSGYAVSPVPEIARRAYADGMVTLVQRRLAPFKFEYLAVKLPRKVVRPQLVWHIRAARDGARIAVGTDLPLAA